MTKHLTLLLFIGLAWGQKQYNIEHIVEQGGVHKKKFSDETVNGEVFKMVGDLKVPLGSMKNGKKDGTWVLWNNDGTKSEEKSYKNGEKFSISECNSNNLGKSYDDGDKEGDKDDDDPTKKYKCAEIGDWNLAQKLLGQGHSYLDRDKDGEACEVLAD